MRTHPFAAARLRRAHALALAALVGATLAACDETPPAAPAQAHGHAAPSAAATAELTPLARQQLAELRAATARFHDFAEAAKAHYSEESITECMTDPTRGGMGFHYGDISRFDAVVQHDAPEILVYEPQPDGRLRFVAVEFAIPFDAWTSAEPPVLFGQPFHRNYRFGLWVLHAWVGRENPSGMFADYNPRVTCPAA